MEYQLARIKADQLLKTMVLRHWQGFCGQFAMQQSNVLDLAKVLVDELMENAKGIQRNCHLSHRMNVTQFDNMRWRFGFWYWRCPSIDCDEVRPPILNLKAQIQYQRTLTQRH
jgi:hypothetical protein